LAFEEVVDFLNCRQGRTGIVLEGCAGSDEGKQANGPAFLEAGDVEPVTGILENNHVEKAV
jgi:hypothetical protein